MPSQESEAIAALWKRINGFLGDQPKFDIDLYRIIMEELSTAATEPENVTYQQTSWPGSTGPALWCKPLDADPSRVILYAHGGAFIAGSPDSHRKLAGHLAKRAGCYALLIHYRQSPEHKFPSQIEDMAAAYKWLREIEGVPPQSIAFAGDSAGGNLAIATALMKGMEGEAPAAVAVFSPWLDMALSGASHETNAARDVVVLREAIAGVVSQYVGTASLQDPLIDLLHADLTSLPPTFLATGEAEVLQDDSVRLADKARADGVDVELQLAENMQHCFVFMAGNAPEADESLEKAAQFIKKYIR